MSKISRQVLIGALTLIFLSSGCGRLTTGVPYSRVDRYPSGTTVLAHDFTWLPLPLQQARPFPQHRISPSLVKILYPCSASSVWMLNPMPCWFCRMSPTSMWARFAPVSCLTADVVGGKRILICHGPQSTSFNLNICSDPSNCLQFPVALQTCPLLQAGCPHCNHQRLLPPSS